MSAVCSPPLLTSVATGHSPSLLFMEQMVCTTESNGARKKAEKGRGRQQIGLIVQESIEESEGVVRSDKGEKDNKRADKTTSGRNLLLIEKRRLLGDEGHLPIKVHPVAAGYHGNWPPEMVSAVIMKPIRSAVCFFSASIRF